MLELDDKVDGDGNKKKYYISLTKAPASIADQEVKNATRNELRNNRIFTYNSSGSQAPMVQREMPPPDNGHLYQVKIVDDQGTETTKVIHLEPINAAGSSALNESQMPRGFTPNSKALPIT